jgi:hypothetical protein
VPFRITLMSDFRKHWQFYRSKLGTALVVPPAVKRYDTIAGFCWPRGASLGKPDSSTVLRLRAL